MTPEFDPDLSLVLALQKGDKNALNEIMAKHSEALYRFIYRYFPHEQTAQEITQDVFVRCYFSIHQFQLKNKKAKFSTWLYRIATNLCHDHARSRFYRKNQKTFSLFEKNNQDYNLDQTLATPAQNPTQSLQTKEELIVLQMAINELPHDLKTALIFTTLENRSHAECAEILKTTSKTIEMRVYRARKLLSQKLNRS